MTLPSGRFTRSKPLVSNARLHGFHPMNTSRVGNVLEKRIHDLFQAEIDADRFWAKKSNCKVFWKKGYHSKDRNTEIVFDVSIEIFLPGSKDYSSLVLIECKNYTHSVPVDDAEEFFAKVQQVAAANAKAVIASTASFQSGARSYAKAKGIGLMRYFDAAPFKWELRRSPSATARSTSVEDTHFVLDGLARQDFQSQAFDLYLQSPTRETNSLWDFVEDLILDGSLTPAQTRRVSNPRSKLTNQVPFLEKEQLESQSAEILADLGYVNGETPLVELCARERERSHLTVNISVAPNEFDVERSILGRIIFEPLVIDVYTQSEPNRGRDRFTLAHELGHYLLSHGRYLVRETCDPGDFTLHRQSMVDGSDLSRMEFQANFFAASLLMPRTHVLEDFRRLVRTLEISDKGFGALYVDNQACNLHNYEVVTGDLMRQYGVSRTAATIRLQSLGLLRDARMRVGPRSMLDVLSFPVGN